MLELAVLGLLHESPLHGYELRQRLKATLGTFRAFSYGSLYPTLRRMRDAGWIAEDEGDAEVVADAPALTGRRGKVVYKLTRPRRGRRRAAPLEQVADVARLVEADHAGPAVAGEGQPGQRAVRRREPQRLLLPRDLSGRGVDAPRVADQDGPAAGVGGRDPRDCLDDAAAEGDRVDAGAVEVAGHQRVPARVAGRAQLLDRHVGGVRGVELRDARLEQRIQPEGGCQFQSLKSDMSGAV